MPLRDAECLGLNRAGIAVDDDAGGVGDGFGDHERWRDVLAGVTGVT